MTATATADANNTALPITLRRIVPQTNMRRQYSVAVGRDLFGTPVVVCRWGRIGQAGRMRTHVCPSMEAAKDLAADVVTRRRRRGYSSGHGAGGDVHQPSKVRTKRPVAGQTRHCSAAAKNTAAVKNVSAAQFSLFDAYTLRPTWPVESSPHQACLTRPTVSAERPQLGPRTGAQPVPLAWPLPLSSAPRTTATAASAPAAIAAPLMRLLGKPATAHEREQWIEALATDPRMQGRLRRGRDFLGR